MSLNRRLCWCGIATTIPVVAALLLSLFTANSDAAPTKLVEEPTNKDEKKDEKKVDEQPKAPTPIDEFDDLFKKLIEGGPNGADPAELQKEIEKILQQMQQQFPLPPNMPNQAQPNIRFQIIGPNGARFNRLNNLAQQQAGGRLGIRFEVPSPALVDQLDLPKNQGVVVKDITADSPAEKAGIKANDIILEIGGKMVPSDTQEFRNLIKDIKPDDALDIVLLRKGRKETIKGVKLPEVKEENIQPFFPIPQIIPNPQIIPFPALPIQPQFGGGGIFNGEQFSISNRNGVVTATLIRNGVSTTVKGAMNERKLEVEEIIVKDGEKEVKAASVDKLPEEYREQAENVIKRVSR